MKRSPISLVSNEENKIIGLIFGRETKHDLYRNAEIVVKAFEKAKELNGSVHFLKQCADIKIQQQIEYLSEIEKISFYEYFPKPEEFGGSIRSARKACIDAILSESYYTYFLTVDNDPMCTLTRIFNDTSLSYRINVTYVRTPEKIKEEEAKIKEEHWKMETKKELQKHALNIGLIFGDETSFDRDRTGHAVEKAFKKAQEMNGVVHILQLCKNRAIACEFKYFSETTKVPFYEHIPKVEEFGGSLIAAQRACVDIILSESYYTHFVTVQNDPKCILTRIYDDTSLSYRLNVTYVRASVQIEEIKESLLLDKFLLTKAEKAASQTALEKAIIRYNNEMNLSILKKIKI